MKTIPRLLVSAVTLLACAQAASKADDWLDRLDAALGYRFTARTQLKLQWSLQHEDSAPRAYGNTLAAQFTVKF